MQWSAYLDAFTNNCAFFQRNHGSYDFDKGFRAGADAYELLEGSIVFRAAIRVAGAVFRDRADVDDTGARGFCPAYADGKKMRVAKGHVGDGDWGDIPTVSRTADGLIFRDGDSGVGER